MNITMNITQEQFEAAGKTVMRLAFERRAENAALELLEELERLCDFAEMFNGNVAPARALIARVKGTP